MCYNFNSENLNLTMTDDELIKREIQGWANDPPPYLPPIEARLNDPDFRPPIDCVLGIRMSTELSRLREWRARLRAQKDEGKEFHFSQVSLAK